MERTRSGHRGDKERAKEVRTVRPQVAEGHGTHGGGGGGCCGGGGAAKPPAGDEEAGKEGGGEEEEDLEEEDIPLSRLCRLLGTDVVAVTDKASAMANFDGGGDDDDGGGSEGGGGGGQRRGKGGRPEWSWPAFFRSLVGGCGSCGDSFPQARQGLAGFLPHRV